MGTAAQAPRLEAASCQASRAALAYQESWVLGCPLPGLAARLAYLPMACHQAQPQKFLAVSGRRHQQAPAQRGQVRLVELGEVCQREYPEAAKLAPNQGTARHKSWLGRWLYRIGNQEKTQKVGQRVPEKLKVALLKPGRRSAGTWCCPEPAQSHNCHNAVQIDWTSPGPPFYDQEAMMARWKRSLLAWMHQL